MFKTIKNKVVRDDNRRANKIIKNLSMSKKLKNNKSKILIPILNIKTIRKLTFLILMLKKLLII